MAATVPERLDAKRRLESAGLGLTVIIHHHEDLLEIHDATDVHPTDTALGWRRYSTAEALAAYPSA